MSDGGFLGSAAYQVVMLVLVLGIVVVFHELGHFLAAKLVGVRVEVFSFGFGRRLFGARLRGTDYRVSLIPLGGYVRMAGEGSEHGATGAPDEFESRRSWEKLLIMAMGPAFNLVLAVLFLAVTFMIGFELPAYFREPVVVHLVDPGSPAAEAGLVPGDRITAVNGREVADWETFRDVVIVKPGSRLRLSVLRDDQTRDVPLTAASRTKHEIGYVGVHPCYDVVARTVREGGSAHRAGLVDGDVLVAVGGEPTCSVDSLVARIQQAEGQPLAFQVRRDGRLHDLTIGAERHETEGRWLIGIDTGMSVGQTITERHGPLRALRASVAKNWHYTELLVETVGRLLTGRMSLRTTSGPIELAGIAADTAALGFVPILQLMALVSLNLGILNLLPIPVLDGGRIAILLVEAVRGRELGQRTKDLLLQAGVVAIFALMAVILYLDVVKKLEG